MGSALRTFVYAIFEVTSHGRSPEPFAQIVVHAYSQSLADKMAPGMASTQGLLLKQTQSVVAVRLGEKTDG